MSTPVTAYRCLSQGTRRCIRERTGRLQTKRCPECGGEWMTYFVVITAQPWTPTNMYSVAGATKCFTSMVRAEKYADQNDLVVRTIVV